MPILIPCPRCSGTGTDTHEDRHAGTGKDTCSTCGGARVVPSETGETQAGSFDPVSGRAFGDPAHPSS